MPRGHLGQVLGNTVKQGPELDPKEVAAKAAKAAADTGATQQHLKAPPRSPFDQSFPRFGKAASQLPHVGTIFDRRASSRTIG